MSRYTFLSTGSTTQIASGPGNLYGIHITPPGGGQFVAIDALQAGSITSNFNQDPVGLISRLSIGSTASDVPPGPVPFFGVHFDNGLVVSATSNARVTVFSGS